MIATTPDSYDVIIVGAGLSGINFAYRLQERTPDLSYAILESRDTLGGTWDLFKYPGIRSDSDLYTFAFKWNPWPERSSIAEAPLIIKYLHQSVAKEGIDKHIRYRHQVEAANWSSEEQRWSLDVNANGGKREFRSRFLVFCTGYYDYKTPLQAHIPGLENFTGKIVHPQFWPEDLDYTDKNVVIVGSGATAITILPSMAEKASRVTMLQRSPSYIISRPTEDKAEKIIRAIAPSWMAPSLYRLKWITIPWLLVLICRTWPNFAKKLLRVATKKQLPQNVPLDPHFNPSYYPWQQRVCVCPDGDFYAALRNGKADVVTGVIDTVTKNSIKLKDGQELHPDIIITATGLRLLIAGGIRLSIDSPSNSISIPEKFIWKNTMLEDVPNAFFSIGYVDASWTLGADAGALMACRLINEMSKSHTGAIVPRLPKGEDVGDGGRAFVEEVPLLKINSTYVEKGKSALPKAANRPQWKARTTYFRDLWDVWFGDIKTDLEYVREVE